MTLAIGTTVKVDGFSGTVVGTPDDSAYGYCPPSMVIVRMPGGVGLKDADSCEVIDAQASER